MPLFDDVPLEKATYVREHSEDFPPEDARVEQLAERTYPHGSLAAHVVGYVGEINDQELKSLRGTMVRGRRRRWEDWGGASI